MKKMTKAATALLSIGFVAASAYVFIGPLENTIQHVAVQYLQVSPYYGEKIAGFLAPTLFVIACYLFYRLAIAILLTTVAQEKVAGVSHESKKTKSVVHYYQDRADSISHKSIIHSGMSETLQQEGLPLELESDLIKMVSPFGHLTGITPDARALRQLRADDAAVVAFVTNREPDGDNFNNSIASTASYGYCVVNIPQRSHRIPGEITRPPRKWRWLFREDPKKHYILKRTVVTRKQDFYQFLNSSAHDVLIFVHGYNVSFRDAALRTAQLHADLCFQGQSMFFSWPSNESELAYTDDGARIGASKTYITDMLIDLHQCKGIQNVYFIGHSMGTRALTEALADIKKTTLRSLPENEPIKFRELILAEPDISQDIFKNRIEPGLRELGARVTLYCSNNDKALGLSEKVNYGKPRLGQAGDDIYVSKAMDTIDASKIGASLFALNHSLPFERPEFFWDMNLIILGKRIDERPNLIPEQSRDYWRLFGK